MKISYAITVSTETEEFKRLVEFLISHICKEDEIVVLVDKPKVSEEFQEYLWELGHKFSVYWSEFGGDFASWKNKLKEHCTGDWIFQLDADELPTEHLIKNLHELLETNTLSGVSCIAVPRENIVDGITEEDIKRWQWRVSTRGINWPDYQFRIFKNSEEIRWEGRVHEKPVGFKHYGILPADQDHYKLIHHKSIEKQRKQNEYYNTIQR